MRVRTHNDLSQWFNFFLTGVIDTAKNGVKTFDEILQLQKILDEKLKNIGNRSDDAYKVLEYLYGNPIIDAQKVARIIEKAPKSTYKLISVLEGLKIVTEITGTQRGRLYLFSDYLLLFNEEK